LLDLGRQGADDDVVSINVDQITGLDITAMLIRVALLSLLSRFHAGLDGLEVRVPVLDEGVDSEWSFVVTNRDNFVGECDRSIGVATVDHIEGCKASCGGAVVVEGKIRTREVGIPVCLVGRDVVAYVGTDVAVGILCLSVCLRVVSGAEVEEGA
jgi:hypothetical protein